MSVLGSFVRRLLVQAVVSGTVMAGLQVAVRFEPEVFPPPMRTAAVELSAASSTETTSTAVAATTAVSPTNFAQDRTHADIKAGRFPVWREREVPAAAISPQRLASTGAGTGLSDVMLFDRCRPGCESRDPLLAFNRHPAVTPSPPPATMPEVLDDMAVASVPDAAAVDSDTDMLPSEGIVAVAARGGLSAARRIVGTAGSVVGW